MRRIAWIGAIIAFVAAVAFVASRVDRSTSRPTSSQAATSRMNDATSDRGVDAIDLTDHPLDTPESVGAARTRLEVEVPASAPTLEPPPEAAHIRVTTRARSDSTVLSWITVLARPASFVATTSTVECGRSRGVAYERLRSASDGSVEIAVEPGVPFVVHAFGRDRGYDMQEAKVPALAPNQSIDLVLELNATDSASYWLRLIDEETERPIAGCEVVMESANDRRRHTDDSGLVAYSLKGDSKQELSIDVTGYGRRVISTKPGHDTSKDAFVMKLSRAATLHVRTLAPDGKPQANQAVTLYADAQELLSSLDSVASPSTRRYPVSWYTRTDDEGRGTFDNLTPRVSYLVSSSTFPEFQVDAPLTFTPGEERTVEWTLGGACTLRGRVVDQFGEPVRGCGLWLSRVSRSEPLRTFPGVSAGRVAKTNETGEFSFESLAAGTWSLESSSRTFGNDEYAEAFVNDMAWWRETVTVPVGATSVDVLVHADRGLTLEGTVLDTNGRPVGGVRVSAHAVTLGGPIGGLSEEDGAFRLGPVSRVEYQVRAQGHDDESPSVAVRVAAPARGIELRLRPGYRLNVHPVGETGDSKELEVQVFPQAESTQCVASTWHAKEEMIGISRLPEGEYFVTVSTQDGFVGGSSKISVRAGVAPRIVDVPMVHAGKVRVLTEAKDWDAWVDVVQRGVTFDRVNLMPGLRDSVDAPAGTVTVRITNAGADRRTIERTVEVRAGETTDLVIPADAR